MTKQNFKANDLRATVIVLYSRFTSALINLVHTDCDRFLCATGGQFCLLYTGEGEN